MSIVHKNLFESSEAGKHLFANKEKCAALIICAILCAETSKLLKIKEALAYMD